ncbi:MAG: HAD family hydrolase [Ruminococcaceae bacterium]|nr:HAD family hydrolase [Oscillospiraceae bacterium]
MINTVLMDLDGTLLPFDQEEFIRTYFGLLCKRLAPMGYAPDAVVAAMWQGSKAMVQNDGAVLNRDRFWDVFARMLGESICEEEARLDEFYLGEFDRVKAVLRGDTCAKELVELLKAKGYTVVLATNPLFPEQAQRTRMSWAGLTPSDFVLVTHYGNSHFCKPNLRYYEEILQTIGKTPAECLMIGNSVAEDMIAETIGMQTYLITGHIENPKNEPTDRFTQGTLADFLDYARTLPTLS